MTPACSSQLVARSLKKIYMKPSWLDLKAPHKNEYDTTLKHNTETASSL